MISPSTVKLLFYYNGDSCHYIFVQDHLKYNIQNKAQCKLHELWVIMMYARGFFSCDTGTSLPEDVDNEGGYAYVGAGGIWKISMVP